MIGANIGTLDRAREALDLAAGLALFHTAFNLLGVLLIWPLAEPWTRWLQQRFRAREEDEAQPRFLDDDVLAVPTLALDALEREVARSGQVARRMLRAALGAAGSEVVARDQTIVSGLDLAIERFVERLRRSAMSRESSARLAELLRIHRYHELSSESEESVRGIVRWAVGSAAQRSGSPASV